MIKKRNHIITLLITVSLLLAVIPQTAVLDSAETGQGVLNLYGGIDPSTLDPALVGDANSHLYVNQIFSGLIKLGDDLEPVSDIAESWQVSDDGRTYTFYLRDDVYFHSGRQVTAWDFLYSWNRACNPDTGSRTAATYLGDIVGVDEVLSGDSDKITGVSMVGDFVLEVTIDEPKAYFLYKMSYVTAFVVDVMNVEMGDRWWLEPNGTGPFELNAWSQGSSIVLERNDDYYGEVAKIQRVVFSMLAGRPTDLYEQGIIDICPVNTLYINKVTDEDGPFYQDLRIYSSISFYYIGFNSSEPPFDDADVRLAFSLALDKQKLVSLVYQNTVQQATGILPPGIPGYQQDIAGPDYNIELAKELIAGSSYGSVENLPPITITVGGWGNMVPQEIEAFVYQWRQNLGVEVTVRQIEWEVYYETLLQEKDQMFYTGWIADYPHPQDFLEVLFGSGIESNWGEYSNPVLDNLLQMAAIETDSDLSLALYRQAEQLLIDEAACIPFFYGRNYILVRSYVKGYTLNPLGMPDFTRVIIENN